MAAFISEIQRLIGSPPAGFAFLEYLVGAVILIFLLDSLITMIAGIFKWIGGK